jgi:hypothetical protein
MSGTLAAQRWSFIASRMSSSRSIVVTGPTCPNVIDQVGSAVTLVAPGTFDGTHTPVEFRCQLIKVAAELSAAGSVGR